MFLTVEAIQQQTGELVLSHSCTQATRQSASVIKVGVAYMNVCGSRHLKEGETKFTQDDVVPQNIYVYLPFILHASTLWNIYV